MPIARSTAGLVRNYEANYGKAVVDGLRYESRLEGQGIENCLSVGAAQSHATGVEEVPISATYGVTRDSP